MKQGYFGLFAIFFCAISYSYGFDPKMALQEYEKSLGSSWSSCRLRDVQNSGMDKLIGGKSVDDGEFPIHDSRYDADVKIDGDRIDIVIRQWRGPLPWESRDSGGESRVTWDGKNWFHYVDAPHVEDAHMLLSEDRKHRRGALMNLVPSALVRYLRGDVKPFSEILMHDSLLTCKEETQTINGMECIVIEGVSETNGTYTVWLSPDHGYTLVRAESHKVENDLFGEVPLNTIVMDGEEAGTIHLCVSSDFSVMVTSLKLLDSAWIPTSIEWEAIMKQDNGVELHSWGKIERSITELSPRLTDADFKPNIRNGTEVIKEGKEGIIPWIWQDGKSEPNIDREVLDTIEHTMSEYRRSVSFGDQKIMQESSLVVDKERLTDVIMDITSDPQVERLARKKQEGVIAQPQPRCASRLLLGVGIIFFSVSLYWVAYRYVRKK